MRAVFLRRGALALTAALTSSTRAPNAASGVQALQTPVSPSYFGMHMHRVVQRSVAPPSIWPNVGIGAWRLWDANVTWRDLEPQRGRWDFTVLDTAVVLAERHNVELLLPLGVPPAWASRMPNEESGYGPGGRAPPRDIRDWQEYVRSVATRYRGRIRTYEIWNEPNLSDFYTGSIPELVELSRTAYEIIKQVDSTNIVVSPSATGRTAGVRWLEEYLSAGGGRFADVIGFHFYVTPRPPEDMIPVAAEVRRVMGRHGLGTHPLWNTETGWFLTNTRTLVPTKGPEGSHQSRVLDQQMSEAWTARALLLGRCAGMERFYWYAWDNRLMGLTEADGREVKSVATSYASVRRWLVGSTVTRCTRAPDGLWQIELRRANGSDAVVYWSEADSINVSLPTNFTLAKVVTLSQGASTISSTGLRAIRVWQIPLLLEEPQAR